MSLRLIFCEGPEDLAALRALLRRGFGMALVRPEPGASRPPDRREHFGLGKVHLEVVSAEGRERVATRAVDLTQFDSAADPVEMVGLSFDPNGDDEATWRKWLEGVLSPLNPNRTRDAYEVARAGGPAVKFVPLPWVIGGGVHYGLADQQCLERIATRALAEAHPNESAVVGRWLAEAQALGYFPTWKMAVRLWNALAMPDVSGQGFYDRVFDHDHALAAAIAASLKGTRLWASLSTFASDTP